MRSIVFTSLFLVMSSLSIRACFRSLECSQWDRHLGKAVCFHGLVPMTAHDWLGWRGFILFLYRLLSEGTCLQQNRLCLRCNVRLSHSRMKQR